MPTPKKPPVSSDSLYKIISHELENGCNNKSVFGGLNRLLQQITSCKITDPKIERLMSDDMLTLDYSGLTIAQRKRWAKEVRRVLSPDPKPQPRKPDPKPAISKRTINLAKRLSLASPEELMNYFPNRHEDFSRIVKIKHLVPGEFQTVVANIWESKVIPLGRFKKGTKTIIGDSTGNIDVVWFNQPYLAKLLSTGSTVVISGKVSVFRGSKKFESPQYELFDSNDLENLIHTGRLVPVYPTVKNVAQRTLRKAIKEVLDASLSSVKEFLPGSIIDTHSLIPLATAIEQAHYPTTEEIKIRSYKRLAFQEALLVQILLLQRRRTVESIAKSVTIKNYPAILKTFFSSLPFQLTQEQKVALKEILVDIATPNQPMSRLLQGEVGSGKTVVALASLLLTAVNGYQGAIMAPTEVLAEQHFLNIRNLLGNAVNPDTNSYKFTLNFDDLEKPITIGLLLGNFTQKRKGTIAEELADCQIDIIIGTHAIIQPSLSIPNLAFAVTDEQHRFGILQRSALREKGKGPHILAMSATPIPRSLGLTVYGDLDISTIRQLPTGRLPIKTKYIKPEQRSAAYRHIKKEVGLGHQAFIIFPIIEESPTLQVRAATIEYERIKDTVFPDLRVGLLHGRMSLIEKQSLMEQFRSAALDILVATPVIEVGIDVPNASVILIESAERFGLAQLHQLRGRVGRGSAQSYCILSSESNSEETRERLIMLESTNSGFDLAEADLRLRGPGDFFRGTRQSGLPPLKNVRLDDYALMQVARQEAKLLIDADPTLSLHPELSQQVRNFTQTVNDDITDEAS